MKNPALCLLPLAALLVACANQAPPSSNDGTATTTRTETTETTTTTTTTTTTAPSKRGSQVAGAVTAPLNDLNLVRAEIPPALRLALKAPYAAPQPLNCAALTVEVMALDATLGADLDAPPNQSHASLIERGSEAAGNAAVGALRGAAEGLVPFRSWVRKLSGAERYSKEVAAAIAAGTVRRGFLKGLGHSLGCTAPASPAPAALQPAPAAPAPAASAPPQA